MKVLSNLNLLQNEIQNVVLHKSTSAPENPVVGQIYFNTTEKQAYIYQETGWENLGLSNVLLEKLESIEEGADKVLYSTMPAASADIANKAVIYVGAEEGYTAGLVYVCKLGEDGVTYSWEEATPTITGVDGETVAVTVADGAVAAEVKISADEKNALIKGEDGALYVEYYEVTDASIDAAGLMSAEDKAKLDAFGSADSYLTVAQKNAASGVAGLDENGQLSLSVLPDAALGNVKYGGTFDPATGVCTLVDGKILNTNNVEETSLTITKDNAANYSGYYFISTGAATLADIEFQAGDWCISNGAAGWAKVDNTDAVTGIKGDAETEYRIGQVNITAENVGAVKVAQGAENANKMLVTNAEGNVTTAAHKYVGLIGDGSATSFTVTHNMGTKDVIVQVSDASTYEVVIANVAVASENTVTVNFATAPAASAYRVIIIA